MGKLLLGVALLGGGIAAARMWPTIGDWLRGRQEQMRDSTREARDDARDMRDDARDMAKSAHVEGDEARTTFARALSD